jgi:hypothetical protein
MDATIKERDNTSHGGSSDWGMDSRWEGTAIIYAASGKRTFGFSGDYDLSFRDETSPNELRNYREDRRGRGLRIKALTESKLRNEMLVVFGAEMSAADAVRTLEALTTRIKAEGLYIGRNKDGDFIAEAVPK